MTGKNLIFLKKTALSLKIKNNYHLGATSTQIFMA